MKKHKLLVIFASFEENCAQTRTFSNTPFNKRVQIILLSMGHKKALPHDFFTYFNVVIIVLRVRHSTSHFFTETHV